MMPEHKYITERFERRTYIKGTFKGKFIGDLDRSKSDNKHERFFNIEITGGEVITTFDNIIKWPTVVESEEFKDAARFPVRNSGIIYITLNYHNDSVKYFKVRLHEIKLLNCRLSHHDEDNTDVYGTIEGDILGYILHYNSIVEEVKETEKPVVTYDVSDTQFGEKEKKEPKTSFIKKIIESGLATTEYDPYNKGGCLNAFGILFGLFLIIGILVIIKTPALIILSAIIMLFIIPRLYRVLSRRFNFKLQVRWVSILCYTLLAIACMVLINKCEADKRTGAQSFTDLGNTGFKNTVDKLDKNKEAIRSYTEQIKKGGDIKNYLYQRAVNYVETGQIKEAVTDLKRAIELGHKEAAKLYEKINPLQKKHVGYFTLCWDGTHSDAEGRGACSGHDGVKEWNDSVFEYSRKYE